MLVLYFVSLILYQGYLFCLINVITYKALGITPSLEQNIFAVLTNLIVLVSIFPYSSLNNSSKYNKNKVRINFDLLLVIKIFSSVFVGLAVYTALKDIKSGYELKNLCQYFTMYYKSMTLVISWILLIPFINILNPEGQGFRQTSSMDKKAVSYLLKALLFIAYQVFFLCITNIIVYGRSKILLTVEENSLCLLLNVIFSAVLISFLYLAYYYKNFSGKQNIFSLFKYWGLILVIFLTWCMRAMIFALYNVYQDNNLSNLYHYLGASYREVFIIACGLFVIVYLEKLKEMKS